MKKILMAGLALGVVEFGIVGIAQATLIDNGGYTTDTISHLDWLDLTATTGKSYNYIYTMLTIGNEFSGWSFASALDFNTLIVNAGGVVTADYLNNYQQETLSVSVIDNLVDLLGVTLIDSYGVQQTIGLLSDSTVDGSHYTAMLVNNDMAPNILDRSLACGSWVYPSGGYNNIGSFLIRQSSYISPPPTPTPEPATMLLMGTGLAGLIGARRKKKA